MIIFFLVISLCVFSCDALAEEIPEEENTFEYDGYVSNEDELLWAVENEEDILIDSDINVSETLNISNDLCIDGGGHTITVNPECGIITHGNLYITDIVIYGEGIGIRSYGDVRIENSGISGCCNSAVLAESGETEIIDCDICDNSGSGIRIENPDTYVSCVSGSISNNSNSGVVINDGTFMQEDCVIYENRPYGILQNGRYELGRNAFVDADNSVFLSDGHLIHITEEPDGNSLIAKIDIAENERYPGRQIAKLTENIDIDDLSEYNECIMTAFNTIKYSLKSEEIELKAAAVHAGNDVNAPSDTMILTGMIKAEYTPGFSEKQLRSIPELSIEGLPESEYFYWKEAHEFTGLSAEPDPKLRQGTDRDCLSINKSMIFDGWRASIVLDEETADSHVLIPAERLYAPISFYAAWNMKFDLFLDGNGNTNKTDTDSYMIEAVNKTTAPGNDGPDADFDNPVHGSGSRDGYFIKNDPKASFAGWSVSRICKSNEDGCIACGESLIKQDDKQDDKQNDNGCDPDTYLKILSLIADSEKRFAGEGRAVLALYAVWDAYPEIKAQNHYFTKEDLKAGGITEKVLLEKVEASDAEDGKKELTKNIFLVDFDPNRGTDLGDIGSFSQRYGVRDLGNNVSYCESKVIIYDPSADKRPVFTRFISEDNYRKKIGSFNADSVWYKDDECKALIENAFEKLRTGEYKKRYVFDIEEIKSAQKYKNVL